MNLKDQKASSYLPTFLFVAACAYSFSYFPYFELYRTAETLLLIIFVTLLVTKAENLTPSIKKIGFSILGLVAWIVFTFALRQLSDSAIPDESLSSGRHYVRLIIAVTIGLSIATTHYARESHLLIAVLLGTTLYLVSSNIHVDIASIISGHRIDLGLRNAQHTALIFGFFTLASALYTIKSLKSSQGKRSKFASSLLCVVLFLASLTVTIATQTRGIWLALISAALIAVLFSTNNALTHKKFLYLGLVTILTISSLLLFKDTTRDRIASESITFQTVNIALETERSPSSSAETSIGVRLISWATALQWISDRPLTGYGAGSVDYLFERETHVSEKFKERFGHLHNSYLEIAVSYGIIGLILYFGIYGAIINAVKTSRSKKNLTNDTYIFFIAFLTFWAIANLFESYILYSSGQYIQSLAIGLVLGSAIRGELK